MDKFSEKSLIALGNFYVYGLIDPRNNQLFYIGKGKDNRVFEHEKESINSIQIKTKEYRVVEKMKSAQENAIALMKENIEILTDMQKALDKNDFTALTQAYTNYQNNLSKLQGIVVG